MANGKRHRPDAPGALKLNDRKLVASLVELGIAPEVAEAAVQRGDPESAVFDPVLLRERLARTVTPAAIEAQGGPPATEISDIVEAFGFPRPAPDQPTWTPEEAHTFVELQKLGDVWPGELTLQLARVYGEMLARIAGAEIQAFRHYSVPLLRRAELDLMAQLRAVQAAFERLLPLADPLIMGVHRRWVEHELAQAAVRDAEVRAGDVPLPGAVGVAFLFCDLKDYTSFAEVEGDAAAIVAIDLFFDTITRERGEGGRIVKTLGDGAMLAYDDPIQAVATGAQVIRAMRSSQMPGVHASVHYGKAIARGGDYFGGSVNLAARLLSLGGRDELLATEPVVMASRDAYAWESIGEHVIRGMQSPVAVFRLEPAP
jgi:class 3 adenylate cyclase